MAQLVVRNLEENVKRRLKLRATKHGRSLESEVREILREAVVPAREDAESQKGFGTLLAEIFANVPKDFEIPPRSKEMPRAAKFK
jgi:plasmid stability protein